MIKEKICIGASVCGCIFVAASAVFLSAVVFVIGFALMMGGVSMLA